MQVDALRSGRTGLVVVTAVLAVAGCNGGSGGTKKQASTSPPASTTSRTPTTNPPAPVPSTSRFNKALTVVSADLADTNGDHRVSKGDTLTITFTQPVLVTATSPDTELELLVAGDSFGTGATLAGVATQTKTAIVVLGTDPTIRVTGTYTGSATGTYQASGIDVAATVAGIKDATGLLPTAGQGVDIGSATLLEGVYTLVGAMKFSRGLHTATLLDDGMLLIVCGVSASGPNTSNYQRENELFDPLTNQCAVLSAATLGGSPGGYMIRKGQNGALFKVGRFAHTATKLANGKVLIAGGTGFEDLDATGTPIYSVLASCYLYDPATHQFTETGKLAKARRDHSAVLIAGGAKVLVFGGRDANGTMASSEVFDSATGTWSAGPSMITGRYDTAVVQTPAGFSVIGGATIDAAGTYADTTADELYDAASNAFVAAPTSVTPRIHRHTATLLDTGDILLASGATGSTPASTLQTRIARFDKALGQWLPAGDLKLGRERHAATRVQGDVLISGGSKVDAAGNVSTIDTVETIGAAGALKSFALGFGRLSHTATVLKDGRTLILGGFSKPAKDIRGMDGTSNSAIEIYVRP